MSARKSPRHSGHLTHILAESALFKDIANQASQVSRKKLVEPLSDYLWQSTETQRQSALESKFIQGIKDVQLDPSNFGGYMVQDSVYCYYSQGSIATAAGKAEDPGLKEFLEKKSKSYKTYYEGLFRTWHIRDPNGIDLNEACKHYVEYEKSVAEDMNSLYLVVALVPCLKLWPWLGQQISVSTRNFGVYESWVKSNLDPSYIGYKQLETFIDNAFLVGKIDKDKALAVYKECMTGEAEFFNSV